MFTFSLVTLAFVLVFAIASVVAIPVPEPVNLRFGHALSQRDAAPFEPIPAYMKRDGLWDLQDHSKRDTAVNAIPEETPTKAPNGVIEIYQRAPQNNVIPAEIAVKAPNGIVQPF